MSDRDGNFEIVIHLCNGNHARLGKFGEEHAQAVVRDINPANFFTQRQLVVSGAHSVTHYRPTAITHIEILMDGYPEWRWPVEVSELTQLNADEFRERYTAGETAREKGEEEIGKRTDQLALIELADGKALYIQASVVVTSKIDQRMMSQQLATMPALHCRHRDGGALLINLAHAVRMTFFPGPEAPATAWRAHQLPTREKSEKQEKSEPGEKV